MRISILAVVLFLASGCATTFETDRDRVFIFGFGLTFAVVSNKTTKIQSETKAHPKEAAVSPESVDDGVSEESSRDR